VATPIPGSDIPWLHFCVALSKNVCTKPISEGYRNWKWILKMPSEVARWKLLRVRRNKVKKINACVETKEGHLLYVLCICIYMFLVLWDMKYNILYLDAVLKHSHYTIKKKTTMKWAGYDPHPSVWDQRHYSSLVCGHRDRRTLSQSS
jgi:hypothetical protein